MVIGCSNDDQAKNAAFALNNSFEFPLLCDIDLSVAVAYGAAADATAGKAARVAALIDEEQKIAYYWAPAGKGEFPAAVLATLSAE